MNRTKHLRVSNPPPKPLLIWDGDCDFCRLWIERWREMTAGKVDYATYQEAADRFPEIPLGRIQPLAGFNPTGRHSGLRGGSGLSLVGDIGVRENGWRGATIMSLGSRLFLKPATASSLATENLRRRLPDCSGAKTCGGPPIFGRGAGSCARSA